MAVPKAEGKEQKYFGFLGAQLHHYEFSQFAHFPRRTSMYSNEVFTLIP